MSLARKKVGIVGAGIMGRLLAWQLANNGYQITLFDKDPIESGDAAAYTAAGMLTPYSEIESAEMLIYHLGMRSLQLWPIIAKKLNADIGFHQLGSLIVSHANDKPDLVRFNQQLNFKLSELSNSSHSNTESSYSSRHSPKQIEHDDLAELEPELSSKFSEATWLPQEAWLCPRCVMGVLADQLLDKRISWHAHTKIDGLKVDSGKNQVTVKRQNYQFDWIIDCRGLGAKPDMSELRGVRGELVLLQAPDVKINRLVRLMHPRYRLYVVPKYKDDLYTLGATQIESDDSGPITVRSTLELLTAAYSLHPGFAEARLIETKTNCRPALSDNLPRVEVQNNLIRINGLYRHGFLLAPAIANEVQNFLTHDGDYSSGYQGLFRASAKEVSE
ncbi:glycine oxidase ThiO [Aliikangiella coralliicola]|uniref:D-amino-acid oxidase n=1 Tax=Aliikangiella coralliicola TaxID=2592383 RepID=A0A545UHY9_9GAMM|nr:glycine oxidase ThiO [Aliikangiella coralliicola]TQV89082.1 glycine oxidase ThiO [Aliikangiella coralliicola]